MSEGYNCALARFPAHIVLPSWNNSVVKLSPPGIFEQITTFGNLIFPFNLSRKRERKNYPNLIGFFLVAEIGFFFSSLFVVTKSNQKRPDKKNLHRLRLRADSFLSQWKGLLTLRAVAS
jgi:Na+/H+ antiporter NhaA